MLWKRLCAGAAAALLIAGMIGGAEAELRLREPGSRMPALRRTAEESRCRNWWGVLYGDAPRLARAEDGEAETEDEGEIEFVWPLWHWLLRLLGLD